MWKLFSNKTKEVPVTKNTTVISQVIKKTWRNNMWVMSPDGIGIIFDLTEPVRVHLVNEDGTTKADKYYNSALLRQAKYLEIPKARRDTGCSKERALELGYE